MGKEFRTATAGDLAELARLAGDLGYATDEAELGARLRRLLAADTHRVFVVDGAPAPSGAPRLAGWIHVCVSDTLLASDTILIAGLVVDAGERGRGVGRTLVAAAEAWGRERGARRIQVRSRLERAGAHEFYGALGYEPQKTQRLFARELEQGSG